MSSTQNTIPKEWQRVKLGDITNITNGKTNTQDAVVNGEYPLFDRSVLIKRSSKYLFDNTAIILPGEGSDFVPRYYSGKFDLHQRAYAIFPNEGIFPFFLFQYLYANKDLFVQKSVGSTVRSLRLPIIQSIDVLLPPLDEQKKIAEILSTVDLEIEKTEEIISQTEKLKNGLMQNLFTKGIGHKGFKETSVGMIPKEWEVVTVKSVTKTITKGTTPTTYGHSFTNEGVNFFKIENIDNNGNIDLSKCKHISETTHQFLRRSQLLCNDILFSIAGAIGRIAIVGKEHLPANTNQAIAIIRPTENINAIYLAKILGSDFAQRQVMGKVVQLAQANISLERLGLILIPLPTLSEQKEITDILLSFDQKIITDIKYKKVLIKLKKGLASDLLSGKVRVNK